MPASLVGLLYFTVQ